MDPSAFLFEDFKGYLEQVACSEDWILRNVIRVKKIDFQ